MTIRGWNPPSFRSGAAGIEDGGWQGRAGRGLCTLPLCLCVSVVMLWFGLSASQAQNYTVDWHKIAGGGGTSSNGQYAVSGTIGQPDAGGPMSGGNYSLTGGFWALISVVQTAGVPTLYISHSGNAVQVYWQAVPGWTLQQTANLAAGNGGWSDSSGVASANGTNSLSLTAPTGNLFFRLEQP